VAESRFQSILRARLEQVIEQRSVTILDGGLEPDLYKSETGFINGLRTAILLMSEIEKGLE